MRLSFIIHATFIALCAIAPARLAGAQEAISAASVSGRVTDAQGAVVPGAQVVARQIETNVKSETVTDGEGRFRFPYLKVGPYDITVHLQGFQDVTRTLILTVGSAFELPVSLAIAGLDASVTVAAQATILEAARSQIASTVSQDEVRSLPMNGRNFLDLALLVPGVSPTNVASTQLFAETSAVPGPGLSVGSQRNFSNNFIVDGLSANDDAAGLSGIPYAVDAIEQFQVVTSGGQAELGRALGGYVNVVTKSGTNTTRGDLYLYLRDDAFNAPNALTGATLPMHQNQFGGSLGGPIRRDRTFYFANIEQRDLDQVGLTTIAPAAVDAINARLSATGYPGSLVSTGTYPNPVETSNLLAKIEHQTMAGDHVGVRYSQYGVASSRSRGAGGLSAPTASAGLDNVDRTIAVSHTRTLSTRTVNETRAQYAFGDLQAPPTDQVGPAVSIQGVASFGTLSGSPTRRVNRLYEVVNNLSHQAGAHALRAGADFLFNDDTITYPRSIRGAYTFSSLPNFLAGVYNNAGFTQTFGANRRVPDEPESRAVRPGRVEGQLESDDQRRDPLRPAVARNDQDGSEQRRAAGGVRVDAVRVARHARSWHGGSLLRPRAAARAGQCPALSEQHQRRDQPEANRHQPVAGPSGRAGVPRHSERRDPVGDAAEPDHHASEHAECLFASGRRRGRTSAWRSHDDRHRLSVRPRRGSDHFGEPERAVVRRRRDEQRLPPESELREQQPVLAAGDVELSRPACVVRAAAGAVGFVSRVVHAVEREGERRRVFLQLADRSLRPLEGLGPIR